jgi:hypothetical protein
MKMKKEMYFLSQMLSPHYKRIIDNKKELITIYTHKNPKICKELSNVYT